MSDRPDFRAGWRASDRAMAGARPSQRLDARVQASLSRVVPRSALAILAATTAAVLFLFLREDPEPQPAMAQAETALFAPASCAPVEARADLLLALGCRVALEDPAMTIEARTDVLLRRTQRGIRVVKGTAAFRVEKVGSGPAVIVLVSGGQIEVLGTRFVVSETGYSGAVSLEEGRIAFLALDGDRAHLSPGGVHRWQRPRAPIAEAPKPPDAPPVPPRAKPIPRAKIASEPVAPPIEPPSPPPPPPVAAVEEDADDLPPAQWSVERTGRAVERVSELRAHGRWPEAVALIAKLLQAPLDARAAEVLSFERGELLSHKLMQPAEACRHWAAHRQRFAGGRYQVEVERALSGCRQETRAPLDGE